MTEAENPQRDPTPAPRVTVMAEKKPDPSRPKLVLHNVIAMFPNLFEPREYNGSLRYECTLAWTAGSPQLPEHLAFQQQLDQVAAQVMAQKFPGATATFVRDGNERTAQGFAGRRFVNAYVRANKGKPAVFDANQAPLTVQSGVLLRGGCLVNAIISPWAWKDERGKAGLSVNLHAVQYLGEYEEYAGGDVDASELAGAFGAVGAPAAPAQPAMQPAPAAPAMQPAPAAPAAPAAPGTPSWA